MRRFATRSPFADPRLEPHGETVEGHPGTASIRVPGIRTLPRPSIKEIHRLPQRRDRLRNNERNTGGVAVKRGLAGISTRL
jgi:hypothetical protein